MRDQAPRFREAYPRFDVLRAVAEHRKGRALCVFEDERGGTAGWLGFTPTATHATIEGNLSGRYIGPWTGPDEIALIRASNSVGLDARVTACPLCERRVQILVLRFRWGCPRCHRLLYRRQLVDRESLLWEELGELKEALKRGRRKGEHQRRFDARVRRRDELATKLVGKPRHVASVEHLKVVSSRWISEAERIKERGLDLF